MISTKAQIVSLFFCTCFVTVGYGAAAEEPTRVAREFAKHDVRVLGGNPAVLGWAIPFETLLQQPNDLLGGDYPIFWLMRLDLFDEAVMLIQAGADVTHLSLKDGMSIFEIFASSMRGREKVQQVAPLVTGPDFRAQTQAVCAITGSMFVLQDLLDRQFVRALRTAIDNQNIAEFKWLCVVLNHGFKGGTGSHLVSVFMQSVEKNGIVKLIDYAKERGWMEYVRSVIIENK